MTGKGLGVGVGVGIGIGPGVGPGVGVGTTGWGVKGLIGVIGVLVLLLLVEEFGNKKSILNEKWGITMSSIPFDFDADAALAAADAELGALMQLKYPSNQLIKE